MPNHRATGRAQLRPLATSPRATHRDATAIPVGVVKAGVLGALATATIAVPVASAAASQGGVIDALPDGLVGAAHAAPAGSAPVDTAAEAPAVKLPASTSVTASISGSVALSAKPATKASAATAEESTAEATATEEDAAADEATVDGAAEDDATTGTATGSGAAASADVAPASGGYIKPVDAPITSNYGWRIHPTLGYKKLHNGADFGAACGTPADAVQAGVVTEVSRTSSSGNRVFVDHGNGVITGYFHLQSFKVKEGDKVAQGQAVGLVGDTGRSTGCHLHFSKVDKSGNYSDPMSLFR